MPVRYPLTRFGHDRADRACSPCYARLDYLRRRDSYRASPESPPPAVKRSGSAVWPGPAEVRRAALAILSGHAARGDRIEAERFAGIDAGPGEAGPTAAETARRCVREYDASWFALRLRGEASDPAIPAPTEVP